MSDKTESVTPLTSTEGSGYTNRLAALETSGLKALLPTQAPYRWNLRRLKLGRVLDVGCGLGRNLAHCSAESVGVDHNPTSVETARARGLTAYTPEEFAAVAHEPFDSLLCAHVLEHLDPGTAGQLLETYLPFVRPGGAVVFITPQEAGYRSDPTHVRFVDFEGLRSSLEMSGGEFRRSFSFPFPRTVGRYFPYNEFVQLGTAPADGV